MSSEAAARPGRLRTTGSIRIPDPEPTMNIRTRSALCLGILLACFLAGCAGTHTNTADVPAQPQPGSDKPF
jgi:hypothetical protein